MEAGRHRGRPDKVTPSLQSSPWRQSVEEVVAAHATDAVHGLSSDDARARLERDGPNRLVAEAPVPAWKKFLAQFKDLLVILLLVATAISAVLWLYERDAPLPYEAIAISAVVLLNAVMGYLQEQRAESAIAALQQMAAAHAHVIRDGAPTTIPSADVVAGDVLVVEEGDTIAADARVIESSALSVAEAALTGESLPVAKDVETMSGDTPMGVTSERLLRLMVIVAQGAVHPLNALRTVARENPKSTPIHMRRREGTWEASVRRR